MNCRYAYKDTNDNTTHCIMNGYEACSFAWYCTHEGREKFYDGWERCGLAMKGAREVVWQIIKWNGDIATVLNANGRTEEMYVPDDGTGRKPDAIVIREGNDIAERWYKPGNEPKVECGKIAKATKAKTEFEPLPKKTKEYKYTNYSKG